MDTLCVGDYICRTLTRVDSLTPVSCAIGYWLFSVEPEPVRIT